MAVQTTLPATTSTFNDIRDTLNAGGGNVNNTVATAYDEVRDINKWSKHKPIPLKVDHIAGVDSRITLNGITLYWWQFNNCGMALPMNKNSYGATDGTYKEIYIGWLAQNVFKNNPNIPNYDYTPPVGGVNQPQRLGDFRGYKKDATPIFKTELIGYSGGEDMQYNYASTKKLQAYMSWNFSKRDITVQELTNVSTYYFVAEVYVLKKNEGSSITDLSSMAPTAIIKSSSPADANENTNYGKILEIDIPSIVSQAGLTDNAAIGTHIYIVLGLNNYVNGNIQEQNALIMPKSEGNGYYHRFQLYYEYMRKTNPISAYLYSGTDNPQEYSFGSSYPSSFTSAASQFGIKVQCERDTTKNYYVVGQNTTAPNGMEGVMFRFVPTNAVGARTVIAKVLSNNGSWASDGSNRQYVPISSSKDTYTEVYLMFENVYDGRDSKVISGFLQASNDGGNTWDSLEDASVTLNINK